MVELRKRPPREEPVAQPKRKKSQPSIKDKAITAIENVTESLTGIPAPSPDLKAADKAAAKDKTAGPPAVGTVLKLDGFGGTVTTQDTKATTLKQLVEASPKGVVLFTYPKASTPGCTKQACLFRDSYAPITDAGLAIYGLSTDSPKANTTFKTKQSLQYPLLCDPTGTLIKAIGFRKSPSGTVRGVFVIDKQGKVLANEAGGPDATVETVRKVVGEMPPQIGVAL